MTSHLPGVRSPAGSSWVCSSASHEAEIQTWGLKQGPLPSHSPATVWLCLLEEQTTTIRLYPETVLDTMPDPDLPVFTPRYWPGLEGGSRTKAAPQRHLGSHPRQRLQCSGVGEGVGQGRGQGQGHPGRWGSRAPLSHAPSSHQTSPTAQHPYFSDHL